VGRLPVYLLSSLLLLITGCGYQFVGTENRAEVRSVSVHLFLNQTTEARIENLLTTFLRNEFIRSKRIALIDENNAEGLVEGLVSGFSERPVSFTQEGFIRESSVRVFVDVSLKRRLDQKVLWRVTNLSFSEEYLADSDIPTNEQRKEVAIRTIAKELARQIHDSILSRF
jgi:outer membrane lipopolysaccharide assembly protein LptE/RlpB